ncbi:hypothetical protein BDR26DRAFT_861892 [Obelidium mucronatum]|nr:hypothetical protein BDR26DRAFT_861892 [Obelidium mucronatum]
MPTIGDWMLVYQSCTNNGKNKPMFYSFDADNFLNSFFQQKPFFRLMRCAMAAFYADPPLPEIVAVNYYSRARKSVIHAMTEKPTYQTVQALSWLCQFLGWKGQPDLARPFLKTALDLIKALRLDIDPDDSPWLFHLNLTPRQKEDRRRAFWCVYWNATMERAISNDALDVPVTADYIKAPSAVNEPYPVFQDYTSVKTLCEIYSVIIHVKHFCARTPKSIQDILVSDSVATYHTKMFHVHSRAPAATLHISDSPEQLSPSDITRFRAQQDQSAQTGGSEILDNFMYTVELLASKCVVNRLTLYLSSLKSFHPLLVPPNIHQQMVRAINEALDAAHRIVHLYAWYDNLLKTQTVSLSQNFGQDTFYPAWEAVLILWFASCKMDSAWWTVMGRQKHDWFLLRERVVHVVLVMHKVSESEGGQEVGGVIPPLLTCMKAMVYEVDSHENALLGLERTATHSDQQLDQLTLGMKVFSLDGRTDEISLTKEPKAFLGLLGMEVGGIRWPGPREDSWRLFWKLHS